MTTRCEIEEGLDLLTEADLKTVADWLFEGLYENPGRFRGMSYERGAQDMLDLLAGDMTVEEFCEPRD